MMSESHVSFATTDDDDSSDGVHEEQDGTPRAVIPRLQTAGLDNRPSQYQHDLLMPTPDERTGLLANMRSTSKYMEGGSTTRKTRELSRVNSRNGSMALSKTASRFTTSPVIGRRMGARTPKTPRVNGHLTGKALKDMKEELLWYDQFTSTDWVRDSIADGYRILELRKIKGFRGRLRLSFDASQGWILMAIIGGLVAACAYLIDILESPLYDWKRGYCSTYWWYGKSMCCQANEYCKEWKTWANILGVAEERSLWVDWLAFIVSCMILATLSCTLTLCTKTVIPSNIASTFDENLGAENYLAKSKADSANAWDGGARRASAAHPSMTYYSAAGSGVAEVKVILSGFVLHGYLGVKTLVFKILALILSVASGMSIGKEGPYVHIATCIGNVVCRIFPKYNLNDAKRREVLSASAASGVAVAFGSPLGGVLFSLEEVSYYFPPKTLFRTFCCCIVAALSLKFANPYGTNKIVLFEVRYVTDWRFFELICFSLVGVAGGLLGALFIKASRLWATTFRRVSFIKRWPMAEVWIVALITGLISYWNRYANLAVTELLYELASPCKTENRSGLCPNTVDDIPSIIRYLLVAFLIKAFLTVITFGIKVPAGIYVPSMVVGGLMGRIVGHLIQYMVLNAHASWLTGHCPASAHLEECITPGVYALVAAGATMCGVTRLSVTLVVILFELTGSLDHVLPFSLGVLFAKWTADWVEPRSIYDLLIDMNAYPFMDNRVTPVFDTELGDITPRPRPHRVIDVSISPYVKASELREQLADLQHAGEIDGGLPIIRDKVLIGLLPVPDLEFALDRIQTPEEDTLCLMSTHRNAPFGHQTLWMNFEDESDDASIDSDRTSIDQRAGSQVNKVDLTSYIDPSPVALDVHSPMDLVYQCFVKLGLRYICTVEGGEYRGMVHKKLLVKYVKDNELELDGH